MRADSRAWTCAVAQTPVPCGSSGPLPSRSRTGEGCPSAHNYFDKHRCGRADCCPEHRSVWLECAGTRDRTVNLFLAAHSSSDISTGRRLLVLPRRHAAWRPDSFLSAEATPAPSSLSLATSAQSMALTMSRYFSPTAMASSSKPHGLRVLICARRTLKPQYSGRCTPPRSLLFGLVPQHASTYELHATPRPPLTSRTK